MRVSDLMSRNVISAAPGCTALEASRLLRQHNIGALPVVDEAGRLQGIVTDRDIVTRCVAAQANPATTPLSAVMTREAVTAAPGDDIRDAAQCMADKQVRRLPVMEDSRLVGMLSLGDISGVNRGEAAQALEEISEPPKTM